MATATTVEGQKASNALVLHGAKDLRLVCAPPPPTPYLDPLQTRPGVIHPTLA